MSTNKFVGRKTELQILNKLLGKKSSSLVVIRGRRRIGKSRLIEEFAKGKIFYSFTGISPTPQTTAQSERNNFMLQLSAQTNLPEVIVDDWSKIFSLLAEKIKQKRIVVLLDEISWMGSKDPDFLGKLKIAWDLHFKKNPNLLLVLCGSASAWIEKNILSSTGFLGRVSLRLNLQELHLNECNQFWSEKKYISAYEKFKILSVIGGIPRYLEEIQPQLSAEENIKDLCFTPGGILANEFDDIFHDLFSNRSDTYKNIVNLLIMGPCTIKEICNKLRISQSGLISEYLGDLLCSGFITKDFTWNIKSGRDSRLSHIRLSDNYLRFYLRYIEPRKTQIERNSFSLSSLSNLPGWYSIMGLQFENLVLSNRNYIRTILGIDPNDVLSENPFFQRKTQRNAGVQIDYMIQTKYRVLYICEIKFSQHSIEPQIINEVENKIRYLTYPKGYSCRAILVHVNGVSDTVIASDYFAKIIDFGKLLNTV
ncbi:MAG: ATPase [Legionellales bacterium]|nr:MAG: ATPase [Legionellales bacterium]